jgi:hypothetical protein
MDSDLWLDTLGSTSPGYHAVTHCWGGLRCRQPQHRDAGAARRSRGGVDESEPPAESPAGSRL